MEREDLFGDILENFPVLICAVEKAERRIVYSNKIARRFMGDCIADGKLMPGDENKIFVPVDSCEDTKVNQTVTIMGNWFLLTEICTRWADGQDVVIFVGVDINENKKNEEMLIAGASTDSMTGIYNRKAGIDFLDIYVKMSAKEGLPFTVCYLDLNDLKYVNDTFGHVAGDKYITTVVTVIKGAIRQTDIFARMGGDEFILIFPNCKHGVVEDIVDNVVQKLDIINDSGALEYDCSISYGILGLPPHSDYDLEHILNVVDAKMYYMKEEYRRTRGKRKDY